MPYERRDIAALSLLTDPETVRRGERYAAAGAVVDWDWVVEGRQLWGQIIGSAPSPYSAFVTFHRTGDGGLQRFDGTCTCPMKVDCKHTVALLLTAVADEGAGAPAGGKAGTAPSSGWGQPTRQWELSLRGLLQ